MTHDPPPFSNDLLTESIIGSAIEVHRILGPGLLESNYEECLCWELRKAGHAIVRQLRVPVVYKGNKLANPYRLDIVVERRVIVEIKAVDRYAPVHEAQLRTYLRHAHIPVGLLLNFNTSVLRDGLRRLTMTAEPEPRP